MGVPLARCYVLSELLCNAKNLERDADIDYGAARRVGPGGWGAGVERWVGGWSRLGGMVTARTVMAGRQPNSTADMHSLRPLGGQDLPSGPIVKINM